MLLWDTPDILPNLPINSFFFFFLGLRITTLVSVVCYKKNLYWYTAHLPRRHSDSDASWRHLGYISHGDSSLSIYYGANYLCNSPTTSEVFIPKLNSHVLPHLISPLDGDQSDPIPQRKSPWCPERTFHVGSSRLLPTSHSHKRLDENCYHL